MTLRLTEYLLLWSIASVYCGMILLVYGQDLVMEMATIQPCEGFEDGYEVEYQLENGDFSVKYTFEEDVSDDFTFDAQIDKEVDGGWEENVYSIVKGELCTYAKRLAGKALSKFAALAQPKMAGECPLKAGTYEVDGYHGEPADVQIPPGMVAGRYRTNLKIYDPSDKQVMCYVIEADLEEP